MQVLFLKENVSQTHVLCDQQESLWDVLSGCGEKVFLFVKNEQPLEVLLANEVNKLATVGYYLETWTCHSYFVIIEKNPLAEPHNDLVENLVEVLIHQALLVAQLFHLVDKRLT